MKARYKVAGMLSILLVLAIGLSWPTRNVSAAAEGKITGTVKLNGAAPHMKGIDMSKDPYCVKQHENSPAHLENVMVGEGGGLQNVVLYISQGLSAAPKPARCQPRSRCSIRRIACTRPMFWRWTSTRNSR